MCWKISTPSVAPVSTPARELVPSTQAKDPEAPAYGGATSDYASAKGKNALKINLNQTGGYNATNY